MNWINDRFTFDEMFKILLRNEYSHEEAKDLLMNNYSLSALVFQEKIENCSYLTIKATDKILPDFLKWGADFLKNFVKIMILDKNDVKISKLIQYEVEEVTEQDCIDYIKHVVINRTFDGYQTEKQTVYGQLQELVGYPIKPAPDEWDRLYNVDFYIEVNDKFIGIQIKPTTFEHTFEDHRWREMQLKTHKKFEEKFGGQVFTVFSVKVGNKKEIKNKEVIEAIKSEINRLKRE